MSSFSTFDVGSAKPLPVTLVSFGVRCLGTAAVVEARWVTASEQDYARFEVERLADGQQFQQLGTVPCHGAATPYTFRDEAAYGAVYYRLRQVDADGQAPYSPLTYVAAIAASSLAFNIFP